MILNLLLPCAGVDIDECADNQGLGPCAEQCHNSPGFYQCLCTYGYVLAGDGRSCISQCAPGYRIHPPSLTAENSTPHTLRGRCVGRRNIVLVKRSVIHISSYFSKEILDWFLSRFLSAVFRCLLSLLFVQNGI